MGANAPPPPPPHGSKRSAWKDSKMNLRKKKDAKDESFLLICPTHAAFHSVENLPEVADHLKKCVHDIDLSTDTNQ